MWCQSRSKRLFTWSARLRAVCDSDPKISVFSVPPSTAHVSGAVGNASGSDTRKGASTVSGRPPARHCASAHEMTWCDDRCPPAPRFSNAFFRGALPSAWRLCIEEQFSSTLGGTSSTSSPGSTSAVSTSPRPASSERPPTWHTVRHGDLARRARRALHVCVQRVFHPRWRWGTRGHVDWRRSRRLPLHRNVPTEANGGRFGRPGR